MALSLRNRRNVTVPVAKTTKVLKIRDVETITDLPDCFKCRQTEEILTDLHYDYLNTIECINSCHYFLERIFKEHTQDPSEKSNDTELQQLDTLTDPTKVSEIEDTTAKIEKLESDPKTEENISPDIKEITLKSNKSSSAQRQQEKDYLRTVIEELKKVCDQELDISLNHSQKMDKSKDTKKQKEPLKKLKKSPNEEASKRSTKEDKDSSAKRITKDDKDSVCSDMEKSKRAQRNHEVLEKDDRRAPRSYSAGQKGPVLYPKLKISHDNSNKRPSSQGENQRPAKTKFALPRSKIIN